MPGSKISTPTSRHRMPHIMRSFEAQSAAHQTHHNEEKKGPALNAKTIMLFCLLSATLIVVANIGLRIWGSNIANGPLTTNPDIQQVAIGSDIVRIKSNMIRYPAHRNKYSTEQLDAFFLWPTFEGYSKATKPKFDAEQISPQIVFVKLQPRFSENSMMQRVAPIYSKFMGVGKIDPQTDAIRYPLQETAGFMSEDMVVMASTRGKIAARCMETTNPVGEPYCFSDFPYGKSLSLTYRFHATLLPQWLEIDSKIRKKFDAMLR